MLLNMSSKTPLADAIKREVFEHRRNYAIVITGKVQSRKSTIACQLAREIQPDFDINTQLAIISPKNFLKVLQLENLKRGDVLILDEFGVGMNHRQWFSFLNKAINYLMMTHGFRGIVLIVTVPYEDYVDSDARKLFDMLIETKKKNDNERYATVVVNELQYNQKLGKMYYKLPRGIFPDGIVRRIDAIKISYPPEEFMEKYFKIANESKLLLGSELTAQSEQLEREKVQKEFSLEHYVNEVLKNHEKFTKIFHGRKIIALEKIMNEFIGIGNRRALQIKTAVEEKLGFK